MKVFDCMPIGQSGREYVTEIIQFLLEVWEDDQLSRSSEILSLLSQVTSHDFIRKELMRNPEALFDHHKRRLVISEDREMAQFETDDFIARIWVNADLSDEYQTGHYYGFPTCCVKNFVTGNAIVTLNLHNKVNHFEGTGYVPCPSCADKSKEEILSHIAQHRQAPCPFPSWELSDEHVLIDYLVKRGVSIGDNLQVLSQSNPRLLNPIQWVKPFEPETQEDLATLSEFMNDVTLKSDKPATYGQNAMPVSNHWGELPIFKNKGSF